MQNHSLPAVPGYGLFCDGRRSLCRTSRQWPKRVRVDRETRVCRTLLRGNSQTAILRSPLYSFTIYSQYSLNKSVGLYMTTPSSSTVEVFGVLVDPAFLCHHTVSSSETVDTAVQSLWRTVNKRVDENPTYENPTSETPPNPSVIQVVLGEIGPFTPFKVLTCFHGCQRQIQPSWSQPRRLSLP